MKGLKVSSKKDFKKFFVIILLILVFVIFSISIVFVKNYSKYSEIKESQALTTKENIDFNSDSKVDLNDFRFFVDGYRICNNTDVADPQTSGECQNYKGGSKGNISLRFLKAPIYSGYLKPRQCPGYSPFYPGWKFCHPYPNKRSYSHCRR